VTGFIRVVFVLIDTIFERVFRKGKRYGIDKQMGFSISQVYNSLIFLIT